MSKFLLAIGCLLCSAQGWAATLKGRIVSQDGRGVSGAKILVINDLAAMMMLRGSSDRNGRYQFSIDPGHYRIFILKKGFQPLNIKQLISHEQATFELNHDLEPEIDLTDNDNSDSLKRILRRSNREPNRDWSEPELAEGLVGITLETDETLLASLTTSTYQSLNGDMAHQERVQIKTRINPSLEVRSTLLQDRGDSDFNARQIQAGVSLDLQHLQLDASASSIDSDSQRDIGRSREVQLSGSYGQRIQAKTSVSMTESETEVNRHRQLSVRQSLAYNLLALPVNHDVRFVEWDRNNQHIARQAKIATVLSNKSGALGLRTDLDHLSTTAESFTTAKLWGQINNQDTQQLIQWQSQLGIAAESDDESLVQLHQASLEWGNTVVALKHAQDTTYKAMTAYDVFGDFARNSLTPYVNEGFYRQHEQQSQLSLTFQHAMDWASSFSLSHQKQEAQLLQSQNDAFMNAAEMQTTTALYQLEVLSYGVDLSLSHAQNQGNQAEFNTTGITYAQAFAPFRTRDINLILELTLRNQPGVPAWWLLTDLPWDIAQTDTWYEGQVRLNF